MPGQEKDSGGGGGNGVGVEGGGGVGGVDGMGAEVGATHNRGILMHLIGAVCLREGGGGGGGGLEQ